MASAAFSGKQVEMKRTQENKNGIIAALFLFQYSLLIPLMRVFSPTILVAVSGILLMLATVFINKRVAVTLKSFAIIAGLLSIILIKTFIDDTELMVGINFLMIAIPSVMVFSYRFDVDTFLSTCRKLAILNFFLLFWIPFVSKLTTYMRFGYGMVLTVIFTYLSVFRSAKDETTRKAGKKGVITKALNIAIFIVSLVETVIYGNRGVLVVILAFIALDVLFIYKKNHFRNVALILAGFVALMNLEGILGILIRMAQRFGINSYALRKYQYQLMYGLEEASSGRGRLYLSAIDTIKEHPILGAKMVTYDDGTLYVHNLFLQVGRDMGVVMMIVSAVFVIYCLWIILSKKTQVSEKTVLAVFFCVSVVRLMISSNLWERPEFWALVGIALNYKEILFTSDSSSQDSAPYGVNVLEKRRKMEV